MLEQKSKNQVLVRNLYFLAPYIFFRVFRRIKIKYHIIIMKLCMRKCEIVKKNRNLYICNVKKNVMRTGLFNGNFSKGRYAISIIARLH